MIYQVNFLVCIVVISTTNLVQAQKTNDKYNALLDIASTFLQQAIANNHANGQSGSNDINLNGMAAITQAIGKLMKNDGSKSTSEGSGSFDAAKILAGISRSININNGNADSSVSFDPAKIKILIDMFIPSNNNNNEPSQVERQKRHAVDSDMENEIETGFDSILNVASAFINNMNHGKDSEDLTNLIPMAIEVLNSFGSVNVDLLRGFQPYLKHLNILLDQYMNSEMMTILREKLSMKKLFNVRFSNMSLLLNCQTEKNVYVH